MKLYKIRKILNVIFTIAAILFVPTIIDSVVQIAHEITSKVKDSYSGFIGSWLAGSMIIVICVAIYGVYYFFDKYVFSENKINTAIKEVREESISMSVDSILDKIQSKGIKSLSDKEKEFLKKNS